MFHVITFETDSSRDSHGEIGKDSIDSVPKDTLCCEPMTSLMHGKSKSMVDGSREGVAAEEPGVPGCSLEKVDGEDLERHGKRGSELGLMVGSKELLHLWMGLDDCLSPV